MNDLSAQSFQDSLFLTLNPLLGSIGAYLPKLISALLVFFVGVALAKWVKKLFIKGLELLKVSQSLKGTPIEAFMKDSGAGKIENALGSTAYWLLMIIVFHTTFTILGLNSISELLERVLGYIPNVISAVVVLFIGVALAGIVESLVKGAIKSVNGRSARTFGKISSYLIMVIAVMAALSELQIASTFIATLFTGFVIMLALGMGLAFGLGSKNLVEKIVMEWYEKTKSELKE